MPSDFIYWARRFASKSFGEGVEARVTESEMSANPSARLDIDTPTMVARITCWESGDYDAEIIDLETERTLVSRCGNFRGCVFAELWATFFKVLGITAE